MGDFLVIGAGSIGRRHIQCLSEMGICDIFVAEPAEKNRLAADKDFLGPRCSCDESYCRVLAACFCASARLSARSQFCDRAKTVLAVISSWRDNMQ